MLLMALALAAATSTPPCTIASAVPASVREMARDPDEWLGRCVRIEGYVVGNRFFADVAGAYAADSSNAADRLNDGWLGLYFAGDQPWNRTLRRGTIAGVVNDCGRNYDAALAAAGPNTIVMSLGYCHYRGGLTLHNATFRSVEPARFERQLGDAARWRFGDLIEAGADNQPPDEVVTLADRFLAALRAGDFEGLDQFVGSWSETFEAGSAAERQFRAYLHGEDNSPLRALRIGASPPQRAYFREQDRRDEAEFGYWANWHVCFCRTSECASRWPISTIDTVAHPSLPYVCLIAFNDRSLREAPDRLGIDRRDNVFMEPPPS